MQGDTKVWIELGPGDQAYFEPRSWEATVRIEAELLGHTAEVRTSGGSLRGKRLDEAFAEAKDRAGKIAREHGIELNPEDFGPKELSQAENCGCRPRALPATRERYARIIIDRCAIHESAVEVAFRATNLLRVLDAIYPDLEERIEAATMPNLRGVIDQQEPSETRAKLRAALRVAKVIL